MTPAVKVTPDEQKHGLNCLFFLTTLGGETGQTRKLYVYDEAMAEHIATLPGVVAVVVEDPGEFVVKPPEQEDGMEDAAFEELQARFAEFLDRAILNPKYHQMTLVTMFLGAGLRKKALNINESLDLVFADLYAYCDKRFKDTAHSHHPLTEWPANAQQMKQRVAATAKTKAGDQRKRVNRHR